MIALIPFAIIGGCALPRVVLASRRFGHLFGVPAVGVVAVLTLPATMVPGRFTGVGILVLTGVIFITLGVLGATLSAGA